jgi:hypothetical protein
MAGPGQADSVQDDLFGQMVELVPIILEEMDPEKPGVPYGKAPNLHNMGPSYMFSFLYKTRRPDNPYFNDKRLLKASIEMCDHIVETNQSGLEWPMYNLCQTYELLRDELPAATVRRWKEGARYYANHRGIRPYFFTSFNHEAWNALAVYRAGQVFGEPGWVEQGRFLMDRLLEIQHPMGYWEEGPHHGPSIKYNQLMLEPIIIYADYSGDKAALAAARKLADFMIRYSLPDGSLSGAIDGRQGYFLSYFGSTLYGLDRWPQGKSLNRKLIEVRKRYSSFSPNDKFYSLSDWYAYFGMFCLVDEFRSIVPSTPTEPLPQSVNGYLAEDHRDGFDAGIIRNHDWCVILSGIFSDIPKVGESMFRLERQSRLDVWHEKTGLIIGGGHNMPRKNPPLANVFMMTGFRGDSDFGDMVGDDYNGFRSLYFPRAVSTDISLESSRLHLVFGQGDIDFTVRPISESRLDIDYDYEVFKLDKMLVQLPVVVFGGGGIEIDGAVHSGKDRQLIRESIEIENPFLKSRVRITIPQGHEARFRYPIEALRWYVPLKVPQRYESVYTIGLISLKIDKPHGKGRGTFELDIR